MESVKQIPSNVPEISDEMRALAIRWLRESVPSFAAKVAPIYKILDWKWCLCPGGGLRVPSDIDIETSLYGLLRELEVKDASYVASGGLRVEISTNGRLVEARIKMVISEQNYWAT